MYRFRGFCVWR